MLPGRLRYTVPFLRAWIRNLRGRKLPTSHTKPLIIVTGAGRSGTSAVARLLHESGLSMGGPFVDTTDANPVGFYEDRAIIDLHEAILTQLGLGRFLVSTRWPWRTTALAVASGYEDAMRQQLARGVAGWKDPRFSIMLESWLQILPTAPKVIVCLRNPKSYTDSVIDIYGFISPRNAERHWARLYRRLLSIIRDYKLDAICVEYDALIEEPQQTIADLSRFAGHPLDASLLEGGLRHHTGHVRAEHMPLYEEVLALSPRPPRTRLRIADRDAYLTSVRELSEHLLAARTDWLAGIDASDPRLDGSASPEELRRTYVVSTTYDSIARDVQEALRKLEPPADLEPYHDATRALFDHERLTAAAFALASAAPDNAERQQNARYCWEEFSSPAVFEKALRARDLIAGQAEA